MWYTFLFHPDIAFLLFIVAIIGISTEIAHPGAILPGLLGTVALLLFLFAASALAPNWPGIIFLLLALVLVMADILLPGHGLLTLGAVIALIYGAFLFFQNSSASAGGQLTPWLVYVMGGVVGLLGLGLAGSLLRLRRLPVSTGVEGMIGASAVAITPLVPGGRVLYAGENWAAMLEPNTTRLDEGSQVKIVGVEGLCLRVQRIDRVQRIEEEVVHKA